MKKKIFYGLLIVLVTIQFIRPERNISAGPFPDRIAAPADVQAVLERSCYDCHSNNTIYPWYTNIQPVGWWMQHHVDEGKHHLNFDEFISYKPKKAAHKLEEVEESVLEGWMPLNSYLWIHHNAELSEEDAHKIVAWAKAGNAQFTMHNSQ